MEKEEKGQIKVTQVWLFSVLRRPKEEQQEQNVSLRYILDM
jgi:hypothetical protein